MKKKVNEAVEEISSKGCTKERALSVFHNACTDFGIEQFAIAVFSGKKKITDSFFAYNTYPEGWEKRYKQKEYYLRDPVFAALKNAAVPFSWSTDDFDDILPVQKTLMKEARDFGICLGITIPLIPHSTFHGFVTIINQPFLHYSILYSLSLIGNICANKVMHSGKSIKLSKY